MISPCKSLCPCAQAHPHVVLRRSRNVTIQNSPGISSRNDPVYATIPPDSRKPPAAIDPSGTPTLHSGFVDVISDHRAPFRSLEMVLHLICDYVDVIYWCIMTLT